MIKKGVHTLTWHGDFRRAFEEVAEVGFEYVEVLSLDLTRRAFGSAGTEGLDEYFTDAKKFSGLLRNHGLKLSSMYCDVAVIDDTTWTGEVDEMTRVCTFLADLGAEQMVIGGGQKKVGGNPPDDFKKLAERVNQIGQLCKEHDLGLGFHPHWDTMIETEEHLATLMRLTDPDLVFLAPDTAHLVLGHADPTSIFQKYIDRIRYVHFKDIKRSKGFPQFLPGEFEFMKEFVELGQGVLTKEFPKMLEILRSAGYEGFVVVEQDYTELSPKASAAVNFEYMSQVLGL
jgi:inosose dehydratase